MSRSQIYIMELLKNLGINTTLFLAQVVNILIVLGVLYFFVSKPLVALLDKRKTRIEKSLKDAEIIEQNLQKATEKSEKILAKAKEQATSIVKEATDQANEQKEKLMAQTRQEIEDMTAKHKGQLQAQKEEMMTQIKQEVADLTVFAMTKTMDKAITKEIDKGYVEGLIKNV